MGGHAVFQRSTGMVFERYFDFIWKQHRVCSLCSSLGASAALGWWLGGPLCVLVYAPGCGAFWHGVQSCRPNRRQGKHKRYQAPGPKSSRHLLSKHWSHGPHGCHSAPTSLPESITLPTGRLEHIKSIPINELLNLFPLDVWPDRNPLTLHFCWANS